MCRVIFLIAALSAFPAGAWAAEANGPAGTTEFIEKSERQLLAANFREADRILDHALANTSGSAEKLEILLQRLRVHQHARISGLPFAGEDATVAEVERLAENVKDPDLRGRARLGVTTSRYFKLLVIRDFQAAAPLAAEFERSAEEIEAVCPRANALFFVGLLPQVLGKIQDSKDPLEQARALAAEGNCLEELAFVDRHLAAVAAASGDFETARSLNARSVKIRRRLGTKVYLPFALVLQARIEAALGNRTAADANLREALKIAEEVPLPRQKQSACSTASQLKIELPGCPAPASP